MEFDLENPLTSLKEHQGDTIPALFATESDHMPSLLSFKSSDSLSSIRTEAISLFSQFSHNVDPFISYLALNYMDRFISKRNLSQGKPWITRLMVMCCISLAAKVRNTEMSLSALQKDSGFIFDAQSIHRMEILILTSLNWRMRSITPFSFLYFFLSLFDLRDPSICESLKDRASEILFKSHHEIKTLEYKPSIIAASALLCASRELFPEQSLSFEAGICSCGYVVKGNLLKCLAVLQDRVINRYELAVDALTTSINTQSNKFVQVFSVKQQSKC
ncbi:hypothetical protein LguiB_005056 [Lonicera macranthoides]